MLKRLTAVLLISGICVYFSIARNDRSGNQAIGSENGARLCDNQAKGAWAMEGITALQAMIDKAHENGILCNVFWSDDPEEAQRFLDMGIDTILTNDYNRIAQAVRAWKLR